MGVSFAKSVKFCAVRFNLGFYAQTGGNFRVSRFLSVPAFFDRLGAVRRQGQDAGIASGA